MVINLNTQQLDMITEIVNVGIGRSASVLNTMLDSHISLRVPEVMLFSPDDLKEYFKNEYIDEVHSLINMSFEGKLTGSAQIAFPAESAVNLVSVFTGLEEGDSLDSAGAGALNEIGNVVLNSVMGSIGNILQLHLTYTVPTYHEGNLYKLLTDISEDMVVLYAKAGFIVQKLNVRGDIAIIFKVEAMEILKHTLDGCSPSGD